MKRRKYLLILIGLLGMIQIHAQKSVAFKADNEAPQPQWIGAITDEDAHIPSNRDLRMSTTRRKWWSRRNEK